MTPGLLALLATIDRLQAEYIAARVETAAYRQRRIDGSPELPALVAKEAQP